MDLSILTSGTPETKPWLNIVCNKITANQVIQPPQPISDRYFSCYQSATINLNGAPVLVPCNTVTLPNPNFNVATNVYTAPSEQVLSVNAGCNIGGVPAGADISTSLFFRVNGVNTFFLTGARLTIVGSYSLCLNGMIKLNAGDTLTLQINNSSLTAGCTLFNSYFSAFVV